MEGDRGRGHRQAPVVVKLGGSLIEGADQDSGERVRAILGIIQSARLPVVVVPGGGPFADEVRAAQRRLGLSDAAAHRMALLAMHQTGEALLDLGRSLYRLFPAADLKLIDGALAAGPVPVWLPQNAVELDDVPQDWSATSDGLAAWLAWRIAARRIVLVKPKPVAAGATPEQLAASGVVDPFFARVVREKELAWSVVGPGEEATLAALLGS